MISVRMAPQTQQDHHFSLNANTAGSPLPLIPRRPSHMRPALRPSPSLPLATRSPVSANSSTFSSTSTVTQSPTTSHNDSDTPSSSDNSSVSDGTRPTIRTRRVRGVPSMATKTRNGMCPPEMSTPIPTISTTKASPSSSSTSSHAFPIKTDSATSQPSRPMLYTPGMPLRLSVDTLRTAVSHGHISSHHTSNSYSIASTQSASALCETYSEERQVRKKSGALVKSSLKSSNRSKSTGSLSTLTGSPMSSKSEPGTPRSKAVHFDAKLEHVKLFLAEQKPLAVSRDGSPTDDTSGTDSDFPRFIFGSSSSSILNARLEGGDERKRLVMQVENMPVRAASYPTVATNVALEGFCLAPDGANILGKVRVRNLAFSKSIAVRFTFDSWQTTSEVTGRYAESLSPEFDLFSFSIRLNDLLARIGGKTLVLAVRYTTDGREMWDNNGGQNYVATFSRVKYEPPPPTAMTTDMADLQSRLEKVGESKDRTGPAFAASRRHQPVPAEPDVASFRTTSSFASRYDFAASLKSSWNPALSVHNRTQSFPPSSSSSSSAIPWPQKTSPRSPRDVGDEGFYNVPRSAERAARNHKRGSFDFVPSSPSLVKRTPPGTPCSPSEYRSAPAPPTSRYNSFPPMEPLTTTTTTAPRTLGPLGYDISLVPDSGDSELSTPSMVSPSTSPESSPSPTEIFLSNDEEGTSPETHYRQFLNKFCFFTGPGSTLDQHVSSAGGVGVIDGLPRTHSESDIEELLSISSGISPCIGGLLFSGSSVSSSVSPTRASSLDDMMNRSGSLTPTVSRLSMASSASALKTPVLS